MTDLGDKINELNEYCGRSLSITSYGKGWEISSYKSGALFSIDGEYYQRHKYPTGKTLEEVIDRAYELLKKDHVI